MWNLSLCQASTQQPKAFKRQVAHEPIHDCFLSVFFDVRHKTTTHQKVSGGLLQRTTEHALRGTCGLHLDKPDGGAQDKQMVSSTSPVRREEKNAGTLDQGPTYEIREADLEIGHSTRNWSANVTPTTPSQYLRRDPHRIIVGHASCQAESLRHLAQWCFLMEEWWWRPPLTLLLLPFSPPHWDHVPTSQLSMRRLGVCGLCDAQTAQRAFCTCSRLLLTDRRYRRSVCQNS